MLIGPWNPYTDQVWTGVFFYNNCPPVHEPMPHKIENPASQFFLPVPAIAHTTLLCEPFQWGPVSHIVGSWVHLRAQVKKIGSPDFRFYAAWVHGLVGNYCRKTPESKPGQCRGSMVQSTWLTTHPTLGPIGMAHIVGSCVQLRAQVKKIGSPDFRFYVAWVHGLVGNYCRKTPQSKPGQCRGSMVQSTWLTTHPTLGPIGMAHIVGSWVHLRAQVKKIGSPDFNFMWHGSMDWWARIVEKHPSPNPVSVGVPWSKQHG